MNGRLSIATARSGPIAAALLCLGLLLWGGLGAALAQDSTAPASLTRNEPKRVLVLHSFGRDFRPWSEYARSIKEQLERQSPWPLDIQEHTLLTARFNNPGPEAPFVDYLDSLYHGALPDLVISVGAP